jgi:hypothetical protein
LLKISPEASIGEKNRIGMKQQHTLAQAQKKVLKQAEGQMVE